MRDITPFVVILVALTLLIPLKDTTSKYLSQRLKEEKIGYLPSRDILKIISLDHKILTGNWLFFKTITYYGGKIDPNIGGNRRNIEFYNMYKFLDSASYLDPYNLDVYYFVEAIFTWDLKRIREVNVLLERGLKFRNWDYNIPYFLGFNYFYFLKDYKKASNYFKIAAELSHNDFFISLASRILYEANMTEVAINLLKNMISEIRDIKVKNELIIRLKSLESALLLENAVKEFQRRFLKNPKNLFDLIDSGILEKIPEDPYGGKFYLDKNNKVRTTSEFTFVKMKKNYETINKY
ncbi:MAG: hypothetical protein QXL18_05255 [Candidatus Woesearchaeota archaeon]